MESKKVIEQWNKAAEFYSANQRTAINNITNWQMLKEALGKIDGKIVLDAGCGDGYFSNMLKKMGAEVFACDGAEKLLEIARHDFSGIDFTCCDLTQKMPYKDKMFDIIVSSLVLMDIDKVDVIFSEANRVLKDCGKFVFSIMHPCFFGAEWEKDEYGNKLYKKIYDYYKPTKKLLKFWGETTHYHRPLSWYLKKIKEAGFVVEDIRENPESPTAFKNLKSHQQRVPLFMCFICKKN